mgnify:CR=1 FL=1
MSEQPFKKLNNLIGHLPKSKILAGASLPDGKFKFYLSGKKQGRIDEAISSKDAIIMGDGGVASIAYAEGYYSYSSHNFGFFSENTSVLTQYIYRALEEFLPVIDYKGFVGSGIKNIDKNFLFDLYLQIPPLPEQKKIASILTSVDKVIENTQKQIDKLQELKNATMNELLTKGIGHTDFKDSKLGQIPKSWKVCSLGELGQIIDPHPSHRAPPEVNDGIPFLGIGDLKENGEIDTSKVRLVAREEILEHEKRYQISENTIGFGRVASIGKIIDFPKELKNVLISPTLAVIEPHSVQKKFLVNYLKSQLIINQLNFLITGSTRSSLGIQLLRELSIFLPPLPEQKEIASILTSMDRNIEEKQHKLLQIQSLKKSLMQDLLTGKVRVTVS